MRLVMPGDSSVCCRYRTLHVIPHAIVLLGASMTLVGLLPPLCDNGSMLVDGGYRRFSITFLSCCADLFIMAS